MAVHGNNSISNKTLKKCRRLQEELPTSHGRRIEVILLICVPVRRRSRRWRRLELLTWAPFRNRIWWRIHFWRHGPLGHHTSPYISPGMTRHLYYQKTPRPSLSLSLSLSLFLTLLQNKTWGEGLRESTSGFTSRFPSLHCQTLGSNHPYKLEFQTLALSIYRLLFVVLSPSSLAPEDAKTQKSSKLSLGRRSCMRYEWIRWVESARGEVEGGRERERKSARDKKGVECSERAGPGNGLRPGQRKRPYCKV